MKPCHAFWLTTALMLMPYLCVISVLAAALPEDLTYQNPLGPRIPDPHVLKNAGEYYAIGTTGLSAWYSRNLVSWQPLGKVYQNTENTWGLGSWWAPELVAYNGKYYLYYTAAYSGSSKRIGVALSDQPGGPYVDPYPHPLFDPGYGVIDPHVFIDDDGRKYLYYSRAMSENEVAPGRFESHIYVIELGDDMISVKGEPILLIKPEQPWEQQTGGRSFWNEGATVFKRHDVYYLMWSANSYTGRNYAVGFATASSPVGPFVKWPYNPILSADPWGGQLSGPGHNSVTISPDGEEWFIVYHTHVDPAVGGGTRQMNIDRMGFRADGSIYVNGPSLTPQHTPAGNNALRNIAHDAVVTASSTKPGRRPQAVTDGEIGFDARFERYDWVADGEGAGAWVQLTWTQERRISAVFLYDSALAGRKIKTAHLLFSDGTRMDNLVFPDAPGAAVIVPAPAKDITWLKLVIDELIGTGAEAGLSEIVVLGQPLGEDLLREAWISAPQPGATLRTSIPITVEGLPPTQASWSVFLDDRLIFAGENLPSDLVLHPAQLAPGQHLVEVKAKASSGAMSSIASAFTVAHLVVTAPLPYQAVNGRITIDAGSPLSPEDIVGVTVGISPPEEASAMQLIYTGAYLPVQLPLDTLRFDDGVYNLQFDVWTNAGVHSSQVIPITIANWQVKEDPFLPPTQHSWFGQVERNLTSARSPGWVHETDQVEDFMGDAERLRRQAPTAEYLVWNLPRLHRFKITLYTREPAVLQQIVRLSHSSDGEHWSPVSYNVQETAQGPTGWYKLELSGTAPDTVEAEYLRIDLAAASSVTQEFNAIQLGHVWLQGLMSN
ncbi:MAG: glycoside hydrolase family 43 protein [Limnochordia bacterium]|jgi:GH43 family beta-xylosidase